MSKAVKEIMMRDYQERLGDFDDAMVISLRGVAANDNNAIRSRLAGKDIKVTVVRNKLFMQAFADTKLGELAPILTGSNAMVYGALSVVEVAREIVAIVEKFPGVELRGAVLDGTLFEGQAGCTALSKLPTRDEAIAKDVAIILGPGSTLLGAVKGPGSGLVGIVKAIEAKLEAGETISKVG